MEREPSTPHDEPAVQPGLEHCAGCGRPTMIPVALLDLVDEGLYLIAMQCLSCPRVTAGVAEDAELERLERLER